MKTTSHHSSFADPPPAYELQSRPSTDNPFSSLHRISTSSSHPPFPSTTFVPTHHFQIETPGKPLASRLLVPRPALQLLPRPASIPIFSVPGPSPSEPAFLSLRPVPSSGSSYLVSPTPDGQSRPLSTTTYRFGPGRPPVVRLFRPGNPPPTPPPFPDQDSNNDEELTAFSLTAPKIFTRSVTFSIPELHPGTFTWRYISTSSSLRHTLGFTKSGSLLVLEYAPPTPFSSPTTSSNTSAATSKRRVFPAYPGSTGGDNKQGASETTIVAALLRNDEFRSRGTRASCAGNGGRVVVDSEFFSASEGFSAFAGSSGTRVVDLTEEERREMGMVMVLTTVLVMLKREVDRS